MSLKSLQSLKEELQATKEPSTAWRKSCRLQKNPPQPEGRAAGYKGKLKHEKRAADRIRMLHKTEVEKLTLQTEEWDHEKDRDVVLKKY